MITTSTNVMFYWGSLCIGKISNWIEFIMHGFNWLASLNDTEILLTVCDCQINHTKSWQMWVRNRQLALSSYIMQFPFVHEWIISHLISEYNHVAHNIALCNSNWAGPERARREKIKPTRSAPCTKSLVGLPRLGPPPLIHTHTHTQSVR
jgi:hypothetical protein